jgi:hypothetical protein
MTTQQQNHVLSQDESPVDETDITRKRKPRIRVKELHKKQCVICGLDFVSERSDALYCSNRCRSRSKRIRADVMNTLYLNTQLAQLAAFVQLLPKDYAQMITELGDLFGTEVAYETALRLLKILKIPYHFVLPDNE